MKIRLIILCLLYAPFFYCLGEFFVLDKNVSLKRKDFIIFFNEKSPFINNLKKFSYKYYSQLSPSKISTICIGEDKYLFYCPQSDGFPIRDIFYDSFEQSLDQPNDKVLKAVLTHPKTYYLDIPSKIRVYSEKWPLARGIIHQYNYADRAEEMYSKLLQNHFFSIRANEKILLNSKDKYIYFFRDTHWTPIGAYVVLKAMNLPFFNEVQFKLGKTLEADLVAMSNSLIGSQFEYADNKVLVENPEVNVRVLKKDRIRKFLNSTSTGPTILVVGDSFRESFSVALSGMSRVVDEYHVSSFDEKMIDIKKYDYIFVLRAERYIYKNIL
ncbi:MAG: hypothetical protein K2P81_16440 [Bacteriovoracaceae bacterium]|nr:hypothetical protein [Bacteriovoracaceae bacterium]